MVLIIYTKNNLNLTNRYGDMVPDRQKVKTNGRTDGMDGCTHARTDDAKTVSLRLRRGITIGIPYYWIIFIKIKKIIPVSFKLLLSSI